MSNGNSFHNGDDNLELQRRNRLGIYDENSSEESSPSDSTVSDSGASATPPPPKTIPTGKDPSLLAPHERPYVNIYAPNTITYPTGKPSHEPPPTPPEQRTYTNIYARRVAERTADTERGTYSNTPATAASIPTEGIPYYEDLPKKNTASASFTYDAADCPDESAQQERKKKFNVAALILGIASFAANLCCLTLFTPITAILAIVFGCKGRVAGKFDQQGLVGFVMGIVYLALILLGILFIFLAAFISVMSEATFS